MDITQVILVSPVMYHRDSVLSPLHFLLYINDLPNLSCKLSFYLFDDTNIYLESSSVKQLQKVVNKVLKNVKKWLGANKLALNKQD